MKNTVVKKSDVHGKGLFALKSFNVGDVVEIIEGNIVLGLSKNKYSIWMSGRRSLMITNKTKYVNHSYDPNVKFQLVKMIGKIIAIKPIAAGDELLSCYASAF